MSAQAEIPEEVLRLAETLWDYHHMRHSLRKCDCVFALGSHDLRVAEHAARLILDGWAPLLVLSGGYGKLTRHLWSEPEARMFARVAIDMGIPEEWIIVEDRSTNTGENVIFTRRTLDERGSAPRSFILVQKPYMERRAYATFRRFWPEKEAIVASPPIPFRAYPTDGISMDQVIHLLVGDFQRILIYPALGFQIEQPVPPEALAAYEALVARGYTRHLA